MALRRRRAYCRRCREVTFQWRAPFQEPSGWRGRLLAPLVWAANAILCPWECAGFRSTREGEAP